MMSKKKGVMRSGEEVGEELCDYYSVDLISLCKYMD